MHESYVNPLCTRYAGEEMQKIFSDDRKFSTWRRLWLALAESEKELGIPVTDAQLEEMRLHLNDIDYDMAAEKERDLQKTICGLKRRYGSAAILRGSCWLPGSTARERRGQIGGHRA